MPIDIKDTLFFVQHRAIRPNDNKKVISKTLKVGQVGRAVTSAYNGSVRIEVGELVMCFGQANYIVSLHTGRYMCSPIDLWVVPLQPSDAVTLVTK